MIWMEKRVLLLVIGVLLVVNVLFFFTYRVRYEQRVDDLHARLEQAKQQLEDARAKRKDLEAQSAAHKQLVSTINRVYNTWWATPDQRLTKVIMEVEKLATAAGISLQNISFGSEESEKDATTSMEISFTVSGTYPQVRKLVNLIEMSDQFIIIDSIGINGSDGQNLTLNLRLRTLFRGEPVKPKAQRSAAL